MKISEKQIEDVFEKHYKELLSQDFKLWRREYVFKNKKRADLIFLDKDNRKVIVEIKKGEVTRKDIGQIIDYRGILDNEDPRVIIVAHKISPIYKKSFQHFGIEYLEFKLNKIKELYRHQDNNEQKKKVEVIDLKEYYKEPLHTKKILDGNVAFKVSYNDNNWMKVCSADVAKFNFMHRNWCKIQSSYSINYQHDYFLKLNNNSEIPCMDCVAIRDLSFYAGHFHRKFKNNEPIRALNIKKGKIAIFTSRKPNTKEDERFIIAIAQINRITDEYPKDGGAPFEMFHCEKETAVIFTSGFQPKYWDYYSNVNNSKRKAWNPGLIRYWNDKQVNNLLNHLQKEKGLSKKQYKKY